MIMFAFFALAIAIPLMYNGTCISDVTVDSDSGGRSSTRIVLVLLTAFLIIALLVYVLYANCCGSRPVTTRQPQVPPRTHNNRAVSQGHHLAGAVGLETQAQRRPAVQNDSTTTLPVYPDDRLPKYEVPAEAAAESSALVALPGASQAIPAPDVDPSQAKGATKDARTDVDVTPRFHVPPSEELTEPADDDAGEITEVELDLATEQSSANAASAPRS